MLCRSQKANVNAQTVAAALPMWGLFKRALFLTLGLMFLFVLWRSERFILNHFHRTGHITIRCVGGSFPTVSVD